MTTPVSNIIEGVSNTALKYWLRRNGFRHSAGTVDALIALVEKAIDKDKLSIERLKEGVREIEEHGGKRVFLKELIDLSIFENRKTFEKHLSTLDITLADSPGASIKRPAKPRINYAIWQGNEVRVKYSERHERINFDKKTRKWEEIASTNFIVISVETDTGFTKIFMDPSGDVHPHMNDRGTITDDAYTQFYFDKAAEIFGEFDDFDLIQPVNRLLAINPPIYKFINNSGWTDDGFQYSFKGREDVRQCQGHKAAAGGNASPGAPDFIRGSWLQSQSFVPSEPGEESEDDKNLYQLERDLYMPIWPPLSRIQFKADCLKEEVNYAISRIRNI